MNAIQNFLTPVTNFANANWASFKNFSPTIANVLEKISGVAFLALGLGALAKAVKWNAQYASKESVVDGQTVQETSKYPTSIKPQLHQDFYKPALLGAAFFALAYRNW